jgi:hypothetical protein
LYSKGYSQAGQAGLFDLQFRRLLARPGRSCLAKPGQLSVTCWTLGVPLETIAPEVLLSGDRFSEKQKGRGNLLCLIQHAGGFSFSRNGPPIMLEG